MPVPPALQTFPKAVLVCITTVLYEQIPIVQNFSAYNCTLDQGPLACRTVRLRTKNPSISDILPDKEGWSLGGAGPKGGAAYSNFLAKAGGRPGAAGAGLAEEDELEAEDL